MTSNLSSPKDYQDRAVASVSGDELDALARTPWNFVQLAVARNPNASVATLERLVPSSAVGWHDQDIIIALAQHPSIRAEDLRRCARTLIGLLEGGRNQHAFKAGVALACSTVTPFEELVSLFSHPSTSAEFRKVVARESSRSDVLSYLSNDRSPRVAAYARRRSGA